MTSPIVNIIANCMTGMISTIMRGDSVNQSYSEYYATVYECCTSGYKATYYGESTFVKIESLLLLLPIIEQSILIAFGRQIPDDKSMIRFIDILGRSIYTFRYHYKKEKDAMINTMIEKAVLAYRIPVFPIEYSDSFRDIWIQVLD